LARSLRLFGFRGMGSLLSVRTYAGARFVSARTNGYRYDISREI
jgi:hypothetical protein